MASPRTPAASEVSSTMSSGSLAEFKKHLATQAGGSMPATPAKLAGKSLLISNTVTVLLLREALAVPQ